MSPPEPLLQLESVSCAFVDGAARNTVVDDLSFHINPGEIACLLGPSGCGKTTTLRAIAGFEPVTGGTIRLNGHPVSTATQRIPPEQRHLGMVFQDYALFPHLTLWENVCFGLRKLSRAEKQKVAARVLEMVGLDQISHRYPHEISGGQQQRVALARALAPEPSLILLDEPFSNLDVDLRRRLALEVRDILKRQGITGLLVTHDQEEAFAVSDKVGVLQDGRLQQWDTPFALYHEPANRFVANFIGLGQFIPGRALSPERVETEIGVINGNRAYPWESGTVVDVLLRPDDIIPDPTSHLNGKVLQKTFTGASTLLKLQLPTGSVVDAVFPSHNDHQVGEQVGIKLEVDHLVAFAADGR
ncbi:MAG TPA: ABC transporter ATP-binding protein [Dongiaceae bacterium]|nr:ABC transporter ATP-binding protein [Dongiaceae bacterium]